MRSGQTIDHAAGLRTIRVGSPGVGRSAGPRDAQPGRASTGWKGQTFAIRQSVPVHPADVREHQATTADPMHTAACWRGPIALAAMAMAGLPMAHAADAAAPSHQAAGLGFRLEATVQSFCRITTDLPATAALSIVDGAAHLGTLRQVCNGTDHTVTAQFTNVTRGRVSYGNAVSSIDEMGQALFGFRGAVARTTPMRLVEARMADPSRPAFVRVTVSPVGRL